MSARRSLQGFTLLEMLAALALIGLLMLGVWSGIRTTTHTARHGRDSVNQLDRIRGAQQFLRRDLMQANPIPWARDDNGHDIVFSGDEHGMRFVAPLPGFLGRMGPQLQSLQLVRDEHDQWQLQIAFALLPPDGSQPRPFGKPEVLLRGITKGRFIYRGSDLQRRDTGWNGQWHHYDRLPALVEIRLELADGRWPTLTTPLRIDLGAINRAAIRAAALQGDSP